MKDSISVLIVEDEILTARSLKLSLEKLGVRILGMTANGNIAVNVALKENPSLILMDIRLADGLDGIEVAEKILMEKKIPIVFMTGYVTKEVKDRALKTNPVDFIEKPVTVYKIKQIIDELKNC